MLAEDPETHLGTIILLFGKYAEYEKTSIHLLDILYLEFKGEGEQSLDRRRLSPSETPGL